MHTPPHIHILVTVCLSLIASPAVSEENAASSEERGELTELSRMYLEVEPLDLVDFFEPGEFRPAGVGDDAPTLPYRIFEPVSSSPGQKFPLIVWLHGFGGVETHWYNRNRGQLKHTHMVFPDRSDRSKYPFYFVAPQNSKFNSWQSPIDGTPGSATYADWTLALIEELIATKDVDPSRITMIGISSGAASSWAVAAQRPDLFAAVAPLSGTTSVGVLDPLQTVPVWTFHTRERGIQSARDGVEYLRFNGGCAQLTLIPNDYHDSWSAALNGYQLVEWLLERRKGEECPCTAALPQLPPERAQQEAAAAADAPSMRETLYDAWDALVSSMPAAVTLLMLISVASVAIRPPSALKQLFRRHIK